VLWERRTIVQARVTYGFYESLGGRGGWEQKGEPTERKGYPNAKKLLTFTNEGRVRINVEGGGDREKCREGLWQRKRSLEFGEGLTYRWRNLRSGERTREDEKTCRTTLTWQQDHQDICSMIRAT